MLSSKMQVSSDDRTGVLPFLTTCLGPRTELAGLTDIIWPITSRSKSIRSAARCLLYGRPGGRVLFDVSGNRYRIELVQFQVLGFAPCEELPRGLAVSAACVYGCGCSQVKNSTNRKDAFCPARAISTGKRSSPAACRRHSSFAASSRAAVADWLSNQASQGLMTLNPATVKSLTLRVTAVRL